MLWATIWLLEFLISIGFRLIFFCCKLFPFLHSVAFAITADIPWKYLHNLKSKKSLTLLKILRATIWLLKCLISILIRSTALHLRLQPIFHENISVILNLKKELCWKYYELHFEYLKNPIMSCNRLYLLGFLVTQIASDVLGILRWRCHQLSTRNETFLPNSKKWTLLKILWATFWILEKSVYDFKLISFVRFSSIAIQFAPIPQQINCWHYANP